MRKLFFISLVAGASLFFNNKSNAQLGLGGFPKSMTKGVLVGEGAKITLERPDFEKLIKEDAAKGDGTMYRTGITLPANIDFHKTGTWTFYPNGEKMWRLSVEVPNAQGIVLMYEKFHLPKGVSLFLSNSNGRQMLGAYTHETNPKSDYYSNEPVVGSVVHIEMNFTPEADVEAVQYLIKFAGAMYRGLDNEVALFGQPYVPMNNPPQNPSGVLGMSASCHINAICPQGDILAESRKSVARILISSNAAYTGIGFCSGALVNNTANTEGSCKPLFATASHCDGGNARTDADFQYWQFRFNYQTSQCANGSGWPNATTAPILTEGAKFASRSNYPSFASSNPDNPSLVQDFLMLELNDDFSKIPDAVLAGWSRKFGYTQEEMLDEYQQFISFHHPGGDVMKLSLAENISGGGTFNQNAVQATHWSMAAAIGGSAGGSSGSPLFDIHGRIIGVLSGGPSGECAADGRPFGASKVYSKFSYGWENEFDQQYFPAFAGAPSRLKETLDPLNTGTVNLGATTVAQCNGTEGIDPNSIVKVNTLDNDAFVIFPNPSQTGIFNLRFNLPSAKDVQVTVYNTLGQRVYSQEAKSVYNETISINAAQLNAGLYSVNVIVDGKQLTKAITVSK